MNVWFVSPIEYSGEANVKNQLREMAKLAVEESIGTSNIGKAKSLAIWPENLPSDGVLQPLDAFEIS